MRRTAGVVATAVIAVMAVLAATPASASPSSVVVTSQSSTTASEQTGMTVTWNTSTGWASIIVTVSLEGFTALNTYSAVTPCPFTATVAGATSVGGCAWSNSGSGASLAFVVNSGGLINAASSVVIPSSYLRNPATGGTYAVSVSINETGATTTSTNVTITSAPTRDPGPIVRDPDPVIQEFGFSEGRTCDQAQPEGLNWAGVSSGGWATSWSQWMNGGTGGRVCTRTLGYDRSAATWRVW